MGAWSDFEYWAGPTTRSLGGKALGLGSLSGLLSLLGENAKLGDIADKEKMIRMARNNMYLRKARKLGAILAAGTALSSGVLALRDYARWRDKPGIQRSFERLMKDIGIT